MPVALEQSQVQYSPQTPRLRHTRRVVGIAIRLTILAAFVAIFAGGYYLARRGFGREWRYRVVEELHKRGVEDQIGRLTLDPFRGLVAKNVRIFDYTNRENTLALISEVSLDINYAALIHHEPFLNALDVRDAQITFPIKTAQGKASRAQLTNLRPHLFSAGTDLRQSGGRNFLWDSTVSERTINQARRLPAVGSDHTRRMAKAIVPGPAYGD